MKQNSCNKPRTQLNKKEHDVLTEIDVNLIKSQVLCYGLRSNKFSIELAKRYDPSGFKRTGLVGIHFRSGKRIVNGIMDRVYTTGNIFTNKSPLELAKVNNKWYLKKSKKIISEIELLSPPRWYSKKTKNGISMTDVFLKEGLNNLMGAIHSRCCYKSTNLQCKFCGFDTMVSKKAMPSDFADVVEIAMKEDPDVTITITCGNTETEDRGIDKLIPYVTEIKNRVLDVFGRDNFPLQLECAPPKKTRSLETLISLGVNSFSINIEAFNEERRKHVCPGKSKIPMDDYINAWQYINDTLGKYRAGSALIFGIESVDDTTGGANFMLDNGILPNVIPLKPMPGSAFESLNPPDAIEYYSAIQKIWKNRRISALGAVSNLGCTTCKACTLEQDFNSLND